MDDHQTSQLDNPVGDEEQLFSRAVALFNEGDDEEAERLFRRIVALDQVHAPAALEYLRLIDERLDEMLFTEGMQLLSLGHIRAARRALLEVVNLNRSRKAEAEEYLRNIESKSRMPMVEEIAPVKENLDGLPTTYSDVEIQYDTLPPTTTIHYTPHMKVLPETKPEPDSRITVSINVDREPPRPGEEVEDINFDALVEEISFSLEVRLLVTEHFIVEGGALKTLIIKKQEEISPTVTFNLKVKPESDLAHLRGTNAGIIAVFAHRGRVCGKVSREIDINIPTQATVETPSEYTGADAAQKEMERKSAQSLDPFARPADLIVEIINSPAKDGRQYWCTVRTPNFRKYASGISGSWNLPRATLELINEFMGEFTAKGASNAYRISSLRAAGKQLFKVAPELFQQVFWELIDIGYELRTISIVSEEPYIPWELMIPRRTWGSRKLMEPLGVQFAVGRWIPKQIHSAQQKVPMTDSYVIAPQYVNRPVLKHAQKEAQFVLDSFSPGTPISPADFDNICAAFKGGGKSVVHFACHGETVSGRMPALHLESPPPLSSLTILGVEAIETAFDKIRPFVFLNACEAGRLNLGLVGVGGFAESFIDLGASAVIAPLWSVKDEIAHQVALEFYSRVINEPHTPLAEIMRQIRAKAYDPQIEEDTYAAYCFYGDPLSTRASLKPNQ